MTDFYLDELPDSVGFDEIETPSFIEREPLIVEPEFDEPDAGFVKTPRRKNGAGEYQKKISTILRTVTRSAASNPGTVTDAAALLMYGPTLSKELGDLAAVDARIAKAIDWFEEGTTNPYLATALAAFPLVLQIMRNHEPILEPKPRGLRIPFTKRTLKIPFKLGIRLGGMRAMTTDPGKLYEYAFNAHTRATFEKEGVTVATYSQQSH